MAKGKTRLSDPKGRRYQFRVRIPADLVREYHGRREIRFSLRTHDKSEAKRLVDFHSVRYEAEFQAKRVAKVPRHRFTEADIDGLSKLWLHRLLKADEDSRMNGLTMAEVEHRQRTLEHVEQE